ncbi:MAG: FHA domain-containing protein [Pseudomonadales bacterium]|jgi:pSer/pThr/pTyr-binding forkhead associated (FHA) protein|nr:FHA domain-containing protein [Pseudomonadales bacterium]
MTESGSWHLIRQGGDQPFVVSGDVIVGRSRRADLRIDEGYISRRHARLWLEAGRLMVEDLGSANGTFLNGERLATRHCLLPGDRVSFDEAEFYVESPVRSSSDPNATAHSPVEDDDFEFVLPERPAGWTGGVGERGAGGQSAPRPPARRTEPLPPVEPDFDLDDLGFDLAGDAGAASARAVPGPSGPAARGGREPDFDPGITDFDLSIDAARPLDSGLPAEPIALPDHVLGHALRGGGKSTDVMDPDEAPKPRPAEPDAGPPGLLFLSGPDEGALYQLFEGRLTIGRSPECDIPVDEASLSKRHVELIVQPGNCRLHDVSDSGGVYVNGEQVEDLVLEPGDVIGLGRVELMFDRYDTLAEGVAIDDGVPWGVLVGSFVTTVALACAAYLALRFI